MNKYTIEMHAYPRTYVVRAEDGEDAMKKAYELWASDTNGASVYDADITDMEVEPTA